MPNTVRAQLLPTVVTGLVALAMPAFATPGVSGVELRAGALPPGSWVTYSLRKGDQRQTLRLAALDRNKQGQWFETAIVDPQRRRTVFRSLIATKPAGKVLRTIAQFPHMPPVVVPLDPRQDKSRAPSRARSNKTPHAGQRRTVRIPAGTFVTRYRRRRDPRTQRVDEVWMADKLVGWGLVRYRGGDTLIELLAHGTGATTQIRGEPVPVKPTAAKP